ncbi:hypothetical protein ACN263_13520 [Micromonospora sp. WMMD729]|uniref:hypothetical protein n=1 Tax=Micromonospora sp. WMMD729 TaxID=3404127 RepID=UPI003BF46736
MEWSIGHSLIVVVAVLLGLAAGWLLRGRQGAGATTRPIVDGDPVAGLAVVSNPEPPATTDEARPTATIDPAPAAVADEPTPVDTVSAPAAVTTPDDSAPNAVDPGDMALTEAPPTLPATERTDPVDEPGTVDEQPAPAVIAPRQPLDDSTDTPSPDSTPAELADTTPVATTPIEPAETGPTATDATPVETAPTEQADGVAAESAYTGTTPAETTPAVAAAGTAADVDEAEPARATPPVRAADAASIPAATADTDPTGPADDFRRIQGVGPKMAAALQAAGVRTYRQLGELDEPALRDLIRAAGLRAAPGLASWPQQARVLAGAGDQASAVLPGGDQG